MSRHALRFPLIVLLLAVGLPVLAGEVENRQRLETIPLSRRQALVKNLDRFRALPSAEQHAIRELDRRIAEEDPAVRARHLTLLRRYHVWLAGLPEAQRKAIAAASPEERWNLIGEALRAKPEAGAAPVRSDARIWTQLTNLSPVLLIDQSHWIRLWLGLTAEQRKEVQKKGLSEPERIRLLEQFGRENGMRDERPELRRAEADDLLRTIEDRPRLKKKFDQSKPAAKRAMVGRINERRALVESAGAQVSRAQLDQFVKSIPAWLLTPVDSLPPDAASLRMRVLYRMIFPEGTEMPPVEKPTPEPAAKSETPTDPPADAPTGPSPF
jgi:hypothetical protein